MQTGAEGENRYMQLLGGAGITSVKNEDPKTRLFWDIESTIDGDGFTTEVKNDVRAKETGNIAIEVHNSRQDKPSGLTATKANLWCHIIGGEVWVAQVTILRAFTETTPPLRKVKRAGDDNADILLYKREVILPAVFKRLDQKSSNFVKNFIRGII